MNQCDLPEYCTGLDNQVLTQFSWQIRASSQPRYQGQRTISPVNSAYASNPWQHCWVCTQGRENTEKYSTSGSNIQRGRCRHAMFFHSMIKNFFKQTSSNACDNQHLKPTRHFLIYIKPYVLHTAFKSAIRVRTTRIHTVWYGPCNISRYHVLCCYGLSNQNQGFKPAWR